MKESNTKTVLKSLKIEPGKLTNDEIKQLGDFIRISLDEISTGISGCSMSAYNTLALTPTHEWQRTNALKETQAIVLLADLLYLVLDYKAKLELEEEDLQRKSVI